MSKALGDAVIEVEPEVEHSPGDGNGPAGELQRLYQSFSPTPVELESVTMAQVLAENSSVAAGLRMGRERGGWWMDALAAALAAGLLAMLLAGVDWKVVRVFRGPSAATAAAVAQPEGTAP